MSDRLAGMTREEKLALLAELAAEKAAKKAAEPAFYPPSFAQRRLVFLHQLDSESQAHSIFRAYVLRGALDLEALEAAARDLVRRHDALRTGFVTADRSDADRSTSEPRARVTPPGPAAESFTIERLELEGTETSGANEDELLERARERALAEGRRPFALDATHLWRLGVLRLGPEIHVLFLTFHHIICDGWSLGVIQRELAAAYAARAGGESPELPALPIRYSDFARWQNEELDLDAQLEHWLGEVEGAPTVLELPADRPRPPVASLRGELAHLEFDATVADGVRSLARDAGRGTTTFMTLLALFAAVLARVAGQRDLLLGMPVANRHRSELEGLVGSFANTLVIRVDLSGRPSFRELLERVRRRTLDALEHQDLPFERLVEALQPERDLSRNPLFQVMFAMVDVSTGGAGWTRLGEIEVSPLGIAARGLSKVDLTLELFAAETYRGYFEYATDLFDRPTIERLIRSLHVLTAAVLEDPDRPFDAYPVLDAETERRLVVEHNTASYRGSTGERPDIAKPLHRAIAEVAAKRGDAVAVETVPARLADGSIPPPAQGAENATKTERTLSYTELVDRSRRLGRHLRALGARAGERVGVCLERSAEAVVAFLAVLESGAAFVPLDPTYPRERLDFMLEDSKIGILLTQTSLVENLPSVAETLRLDQRFDELTGESAGSAEPLPGADEDPAAAGPGDPAYVIYTSGSTGKPKGVLVPHRAVVNHARAIVDRYALTAEDRALQFASLSFDIAIEEIFPTWLAGATLVIRDEHQSLAFADFFHMLEDRRVSVANLPTPYWHEWVSELAEGRAHVPESLRLLVVGTEQALPERLQAWLRVVGDEPAWINAYGPSEATVTATAWNAPPATNEAGEPAVVRHAPVGLPIAGVTAHVLDASARPVDVGVVGELHLGGAGLALGYLDRPRLTAEAFVPDPFAETLGTGAGARLYATGDRARRLPSGDIEFLGRLDQQVKIRGFRIEVGEIEATLAEHPGVKEAVVLAVAADPERAAASGRSTGGDHRLAAYVVPESGAALTPQTLHDHVGDRLPGYMVPAAFVILGALPMTPSGKVDRRALPDPDWSADEEAQTAPRTPQEEILAEIWSEILNLSSVGIHDDFFRLGGHSLLATRMLSRIHAALGVTLPLDAIFTAPTIAELSARVDAARRAEAGAAAVPPIERRKADDESATPLSFAQQRMWFLQQLEPESFAYNMPTALDLRGDLDVDVLRRALEEIVRRHETLRTTFRSERGQPAAVIAPAGTVSLGLPLVEVASEEAMVERTRETSNRPFDLAKDPPLRLELLRLADPSADAPHHRLVFVFHHIASDGWSTDRFVHELGVLYDTFSRDETSTLRPLPVTYSDYAAWQREWIEGEILDQQLAYWKDEMAGAPTVLDLPTDRPRPPVRDHVGGRVYFELEAERAAALRELGRRLGATPYMLYLAAWAALLHRYTHQEDILVGTPVAGRQRPEVEDLIGFFVNTLVIRARFEGEPTFPQLLGRVREAVLAAHRHQDLPFERLVDGLEIGREMSHNPLFQTLFVLHHGAPGGERSTSSGSDGDLRISMPSIDNHTSRFDLSLVLVEKSAGLGGFVEYPTDLFDASTIERLTRHFLTLLGSLAAETAGDAPARPVSRLPLLDAEAAASLVAELSPAPVAWPDADCFLPDRIEACAEANADRSAVRFGESERTYAELMADTGRLANHLRRLGVREESTVGVAMERSHELVTALVGVLRAGAAYVPLDPSYPPERLAYLVEDSAVDVVLTQSTLVDSLPLPEGREVSLLALDGDAAEAIAAEPTEAPERHLDAESLAYVIYTSGSTGKPKGAMNRHGAILNRLLWMQGEYDLGPEDRVLQKTPFGFDVSVWEFFWPLVTGATLVVAEPGLHQDAPRLVELLAEESVTTLHFVPSMLQVFLEAPGLDRLAGVRRVIASGEALPADLARRFYERLPEGPRLFNLYGPTEAAIDVTHFPTSKDDTRVPIGKPVANTSILLLDRHFQAVPRGVAGELAIGGVQLARGYLGRPGLTAERFVPDPFAGAEGASTSESGGRIYRTGDLARLLPSGDVEYLGRLDHQVKVRGFRIELGEIEAALDDAEAVRESVVVARDQRLVAYLTRADGVAAGEADGELIRALRRRLGERLPEYMVPAVFMILESLPLTPNGKVDRKALPEPEVDRSAVGAAYEAPRNETEEKLAAIWREVLRVERVGVHDSFFELGGHSLLATQVMARLGEAFDVDLPLRTLFETPTVAALADAILAREVSQVDESLLEQLLAELE